MKRIELATPEISYEIYCTVLDNLGTGAELAFGLPTELIKFGHEIKEILERIGERVAVGFTDLITAFKQRDVFSLLKAVHFNLKTVLHAMLEVSSIISKGLIHVFEILAKSNVVRALRDGATTVDKVLDEHPLLRKLTGPVLAGLLLWIWLSMTFVGDPRFDMDLTTAIDAFKGNFSVADLFTSPSGLAMIALLGTGFMGLSVPWLGSSVYNLIVALIYTGYKKLRDRRAKIIQQQLELKRY
jgi:hypothetical protein